MGAGCTARLLLAVALAFLAGAIEAEAGAWNQAPGHGIVIVDYTLSGGSRYFDGEGKLAPAAAYDKQEGIGYLEYGVTDWLMGVVKPAYDVVSLASVPGSSLGTRHYSGLGTSDAGAQIQLPAWGPAVFAVQGTFRLPGTTSQKNPAEIGNTSRDAELRGLAGLPFNLGPWPAFLDGQAGYRLRSSGAPAEWHLDLTFGAKPAPKFLVLLQSFNTVPQGAGTGWFPRSRYSKLGASLVYDLTLNWSVEAGVFETVGGTEALRERGFHTGVWYRF